LRLAPRRGRNSWSAPLKAGYGEDQFAATELVPLRRVDVLEAAALVGIAEPEAFLKRIDELGLASLAGKPIT